MLKNLVVPCEVDPLPVREVEIDEFDVKYTANEGGGHIQNDTITLNYRLSGAHKQLDLAFIFPYLHDVTVNATGC